MTNLTYFKGILQNHYSLYPQMQIQDMIKLIYQNEFAGGHLIANEKESLERLIEECNHIESETSHSENIVVDYAEASIYGNALFQDIGNNLCRIDLNSLKAVNINIKTVNKFFVNTSNSIKGERSQLEKKLEIFRQCCETKALPYSIEQLDLFLAEYKRAGYPPISHSEVYKNAYKPSYRVISLAYKEYFELFYRIDNLLEKGHVINIAIDGNSGSGKSTLAELIYQVYDSNLFHMDHFFLRTEQRSLERLNEVGGNVDYERFKMEVLEPLRNYKPFSYQIYNCKEQSLGYKVEVTPKQLNIIEGSYSMHPTLIPYYDFKVFLSIGEEEQNQRILKRNGPLMHERFVKEWIPLENKYFNGFNIKEKSDLVF